MKVLQFGHRDEWTNYINRLRLPAVIVFRHVASSSGICIYQVLDEPRGTILQLATFSSQALDSDSISNLGAVRNALFYTGIPDEALIVA